MKPRSLWRSCQAIWGYGDRNWISSWNSETGFLLTSAEANWYTEERTAISSPFYYHWDTLTDGIRNITFNMHPAAWNHLEEGHIRSVPAEQKPHSTSWFHQPLQKARAVVFWVSLSHTHTQTNNTATAMLFCMLDLAEIVPLITSCVLTSGNFLSVCPGDLYHPFLKGGGVGWVGKVPRLLQSTIWVHVSQSSG